MACDIKVLTELETVLRWPQKFGVITESDLSFEKQIILVVSSTFLQARRHFLLQ